ncbi:Uncharacterised protein [Mycobacteroides abscessus subsp. massiliense]|nr:Uncharacterised protein [Mycobacteroides abscessus subsp. massiliense]
MDCTGNQTVYVVLSHHHGTQYDGILQLFACVFRSQAFGFAQFAHRPNVLLNQRSRINDFQRIRQGDAAFFSYGLNFFAGSQQYATGDAFFVADGGSGDGARFCAFRQNDAHIGFAGKIDQVVTELGWRQAFGFAFGQSGYVLQFVAGAEESQAGLFGNLCAQSSGCAVNDKGAVWQDSIVE